MTPTERDECVALFMSGMTQDALAERFDRGIRTIQRLTHGRRKAARPRPFTDEHRRRLSVSRSVAWENEKKSQTESDSY